MLTDKSLEKYRVFPFIAWTLVISFAVFVYTMTIQLASFTESLGETSSKNELRAKQNPLNITDFSR